MSDQKNVCSKCSVDSEFLKTYLIDEKIKNLCGDCSAKWDHKIRVFKIPSQNLGVLKTKFEKLARRAKKLDLPPPSFDILKEERVVEKNKDDITGLEKETVYLLHYITVDTGISNVKVEGWEFVATIQHTEEGNILRKVGEKEIPTEYRQVTQLCQHCHTNRNRKDTYLLFHQENNEYKQVGRNCLQDFFGCDALIFAERAQYLCDVSDLGEAYEDEFGFSGSGPSYEMLERYLGHVAMCIKLDGWMSRSRARQIGSDLMSTADLAWLHLNPPLSSRDWKPMYSVIEEEQQQLAEKAIVWASDMEGEDISDYLHNIRIIARRGVVSPREAGLAASIVAAYQRYLNTLKMKEIEARRAEIAQYIGQVNERRVFRLHVEKVLNFSDDSGYGKTSYLHLMGDQEGNVFTWWSSTHALETGKDVVLKGTIREHKEYLPKNAKPETKPIKQNVLTRCEEVEYKNYLCLLEGKKYVIEALNELEARKLLRGILGVSKLPRGLKVLEDKLEFSVHSNNEKEISFKL